MYVLNFQVSHFFKTWISQFFLPQTTTHGASVIGFTKKINLKNWQTLQPLSILLYFMKGCWHKLRPISVSDIHGERSPFLPTKKAFHTITTFRFSLWCMTSTSYPSDLIHNKKEYLLHTYRSHQNKATLFF